jgi:hypothetical protein
MTDDTSISKAKADVENWRRGYEAALTGKAFLWADGERTSAWRLGYRDGRVLRLKQHTEPKPVKAYSATSAAFPSFATPLLDKGCGDGD